MLLQKFPIIRRLSWNIEIPVHPQMPLINRAFAPHYFRCYEFIIDDVSTFSYIPVFQIRCEFLQFIITFLNISSVNKYQHLSTTVSWFQFSKSTSRSNSKMAPRRVAARSLLLWFTKRKQTRSNGDFVRRIGQIDSPPCLNGLRAIIGR